MIAYAVMVRDKHRSWSICKMDWGQLLAIFTMRQYAWAYARDLRESSPAELKKYGIRYKTVRTQVEPWPG